MVEGIAGGASIWVLATFTLYLVVLIGIGIWSSRLLDTVGDYVIGGRRVGPVVTGFSERASEMSGWLTLGVPANAYGTGIMAFLNGLGMIPADLLAWAGIAKRLRKYSEVVRAVTLPTFFETRLQDDTGWVKGVSSVVLILFEGGYVGAQIVAAGTLLRILTGMEMWVGIIVGGAIVIGYTMLGGYFAVAWTDYFQGAIILIGFIVLPILAFFHFGGLPFGELSTMDTSFVSITGGTAGWAAAFGIISYAAIGLGVPGNPHIMVRFMGIDRIKNVRLAALVAQLFMFAAYIGAAFVGLYALTAFGTGIENGDTVMPRLTLELFPDVIAGIILAAALAAMMSSADSQLLVATSAVVEDVYHGFMNQQASQETLVRLSRYVTLTIGIASVAFAYLAKSTPIYTLVLDYAWGGLGAAIGPTLIATLWWRRFTAQGSVASMIVGTLTMVVWPQWGTILGEQTIANMSPFMEGLLTVYGLFPAFVLSSLTLVVVSLATSPPRQDDVDKHFEVFHKPLSAVVSEGGGDTGTPDYLTDGGRPEPKAITEMDNIREHVEATDYWEQ